MGGGGGRRTGTNVRVARNGKKYEEKQNDTNVVAMA